MNDGEEQLRSKVVALGFDDAPIERAPGTGISGVFLVAVAARFVWATGFAVVVLRRCRGRSSVRSRQDRARPVASVVAIARHR